MTTADPAVAFAPQIRFHDAEKNFPLGASTFIDYSSLLWSNERCIEYSTLAIGAPRLRLRRDQPRPPLSASRLAGRPRPYRARVLGLDCDPAGRRSYSSDELTRAYEPGRPPGLRGGDGFALNLLTGRLDGNARIDRSGDGARLRDVPVYVARGRERAGSRPLLSLTYWMLYGWTEPDAGRQSFALFHEGGWERVTVLLGFGRAPNSYVPVRIRYWAHGRPTDVPWRTAELHAADGEQRPTHPVVYAARGSHASYRSEGERRRRVRGETGLVTVRDVAACAECATWNTWEDVRPVRAEPWYGYGGGWGSTGGRYTSGPLGPGSPR